MYKNFGSHPSKIIQCRSSYQRALPTENRIKRSMPSICSYTGPGIPVIIQFVIPFNDSQRACHHHWIFQGQATYELATRSREQRHLRSNPTLKKVQGSKSPFDQRRRICRISRPRTKWSISRCRPLQRLPQRPHSRIPQPTKRTL